MNLTDEETAQLRAILEEWQDDDHGRTPGDSEAEAAVVSLFHKLGMGDLIERWRREQAETDAWYKERVRAVLSKEATR